MNRTFWMIGLLFLTAAMDSTPSAFKENIPIDIKRLSDRAIVLTGSPDPMNCQIAALSSEKGLVIIDTGGTPSFAKEARRLIEREFQRSDFAYVILTHDHPDHVNGTSIFPEALMVSHKTCQEVMKKRKPFSLKEDSTLEASLKSWQHSATQLRAKLKDLDPNSDLAKNTRHSLTSYEIAIHDLQTGYAVIPPSIGFQGEMTLDLGNMTLILYEFGPYHTDNDIFIHIPEEDLLVIGDTFSKSSLPGAPSRNMKVSIPRWLDVLDCVLADGRNIKNVIRGHQDIFSGDFVVSMRQYIRSLWEEIKQAHRPGSALGDIQRICSYEKYAFMNKVLAQDAAILRKQHENVVEGYWRQLQKREFAYEIMVSLNRESKSFSTPESKKGCIDRYREMVERPENFFFDETSIIWIARGFIASGNIDEAIVLLKVHLIPFPESADTQAILGEAYSKSKQMKRALDHLQKALSLNPDHALAKKLIKEIKYPTKF